MNDIAWKYKSANVGVFALPILKYNEEYEMSVFVTPVSTLQNAFLYTDSTHINIISARRNTQTIYQTVGIYSSSPSCFIGSIDAGTETELNVKLDFSSSSLWGEQNIPMWIGSGEDIEPLSAQYTDPFWDSGYNPSLWEENLSSSSLWSWIDSV